MVYEITVSIFELLILVLFVGLWIELFRIRRSIRSFHQEWMGEEHGQNRR